MLRDDLVSLAAVQPIDRRPGSRYRCDTDTACAPDRTPQAAQRHGFRRRAGLLRGSRRRTVKQRADGLRDRVRLVRRDSRVEWATGSCHALQEQWLPDGCERRQEASPRPRALNLPPQLVLMCTRTLGITITHDLIAGGPRRRPTTTRARVFTTVGVAATALQVGALALVATRVRESFPNSLRHSNAAVICRATGASHARAHSSHFPDSHIVRQQAATRYHSTSA